jgi:hypothetical protein
MSPMILLSREESSMSSSWVEHLFISRVGNKWSLGECRYNWAASIDEIPEDERYNDDGGINVPEEWNGHNVLGIANGEYIETDELVSNGNEIDFEPDAIDEAIEFAIDLEWHKVKDFYQVMKRLRMIVSQNLSEREEFIKLFTDGKNDEEFRIFLFATNCKTLIEMSGKQFDAIDEAIKLNEMSDRGIQEIFDLQLTKKAELFVIENLELFTLEEFIKNFTKLITLPNISEQIKDELIHAHDTIRLCAFDNQKLSEYAWVKARVEVHHSKFGDGVVVQTDEINGTADVIFDKFGLKKLMLSIAKLKQI